MQPVYTFTLLPHEIKILRKIGLVALALLMFVAGLFLALLVTGVGVSEFWNKFAYYLMLGAESFLDAIN